MKRLADAPKTADGSVPQIEFGTLEIPNRRRWTRFLRLVARRRPGTGQKE